MALRGGWTRIAAGQSVRLNKGHTVLRRVIVKSADSDGSLTVYNGLDADSGDRLLGFVGASYQSWSYDLEDVVLDRGLFVVAAATLTEALVIWDPLT